MNTNGNAKTNYLKTPYECNGFQINEHVKYEKDNETRDGYILCFRPFGYNWFAWICSDQNTSAPVANIYVGDLIKIEE